MERETRNYEKITDPEPLNEDLYHASAIQVNVWSDQELQRRRKYPFREYCKIMEFAIRTLREFGLDENYIFAHLDDDNNFDAITQKLTQALYTLWEFFPGEGILLRRNTAGGGSPDDHGRDAWSHGRLKVRDRRIAWR